MSGISDGFGGLSLSSTLPGVSNKSLSIAESKAISTEQLSRHSLTSIGTCASSNTIVPSLSFQQGIGQGLGLPFGWMSMADPEGRVFYFNNLTGAAQWSLPLSP